MSTCGSSRGVAVGSNAVLVANDDLVDRRRSPNDGVVGEALEGGDRIKRGRVGEGGRGMTGVVGAAPPPSGAVCTEEIDGRRSLFSKAADEIS